MGLGACAKNDVAILILAAALLFLAWRNSQLQREVRSLRDEVGARLVELEEDLFAELQSLVQKTARLRREMHARARDDARRPVEPPVDPADSETQYEEEVLVHPELAGATGSTAASLASLASLCAR